VYRGDREVDLAMARLFGGFPEPFFNGYEAEWPLAPGHCQRALFYNLYHLLNHANLFGGGYWQQAEARVWELNKLIAARAGHLRRLTWEGEGEGWPAWQAIGLAV